MKSDQEPDDHSHRLISDGLITRPRDKAAALVQAFLSGRNALTIRAYRQDLRGFAAFAGAEGIDAAARLLLGLAPGDANALVLAYRTQMVERGLQAATINRRLSALRALVRLARVLGLVTWTLEIPNLKTESYRDLRGPGIGALRRVLAGLVQRQDPKAKRDRALLRVLHDLALRRAEVVIVQHAFGIGHGQRAGVAHPHKVAAQTLREVVVQTRQGDVFQRHEAAAHARFVAMPLPDPAAIAHRLASLSLSLVSG